jgi:diguanylate cyclase (GGDEF)-like protein/PAS domain S-box-containing protein
MASKLSLQCLERDLVELEAAAQTFAVQLMEHLVVPTFVLNAQGQVIIWNRACERLTGVPASEVIGTSNHWCGFYETHRPCLADVVLRGQSDQLHALYSQHVQIFPGEIGLSAENWCVMPRIGSRRYLAIDAGPIYSDTGELVAVVETLRDISVQKEAQLALEALASLDGLTGVANRRVFDEVLEREWRRAERGQGYVSLLMIDIDHFKQFNDAVGHQGGDQCLKEVALLLSSQMHRQDDLVARFGGEEFAVILPSTPLKGALAVADRIVSAIAAFAIPHPASPTAPVVTVSVGVGSVRPGRADATMLISKADAALYQAKRQGRNRAIAACRETVRPA